MVGCHTLGVTMRTRTARAGCARGGLTPSLVFAWISLSCLLVGTSSFHQILELRTNDLSNICSVAVDPDTVTVYAVARSGPNSVFIPQDRFARLRSFNLNTGKQTTYGGKKTTGQDFSECTTLIKNGHLFLISYSTNNHANSRPMARLFVKDLTDPAGDLVELFEVPNKSSGFVAYDKDEDLVYWALSGQSAIVVMALRCTLTICVKVGETSLLAEFTSIRGLVFDGDTRKLFALCVKHDSDNLNTHQRYLEVVMLSVPPQDFFMEATLTIDSSTSESLQEDSHSLFFQLQGYIYASLKTGAPAPPLAPHLDIVGLRIAELSQGARVKIINAYSGPMIQITSRGVVDEWCNMVYFGSTLHEICSLNITRALSEQGGANAYQIKCMSLNSQSGKMGDVSSLSSSTLNNRWLLVAGTAIESDGDNGASVYVAETAHTAHHDDGHVPDKDDATAGAVLRGLIMYCSVMGGGVFCIFSLAVVSVVVLTSRNRFRSK